jgi:hypothetical protein
MVATLKSSITMLYSFFHCFELACNEPWRRTRVRIVRVVSGSVILRLRTSWSCPRGENWVGHF